MRIPSYDDLTPSIPDITPRESLTQVKRFLPSPVVPEVELSADAPRSSPHLFACLRATRGPDVLFSVARDFSPRVERHGPSAVVLDVGGLGRLLGDPHTIGAELERAAAACGSGMRIAVAPTQSAARLLAIGH